jgi:hypothetical protein
VLKLLLYRTHYIQHNRRRWSVWNVGDMGWIQFSRTLFRIACNYQIKLNRWNLRQHGCRWLQQATRTTDLFLYICVCVCVCVCARVWYMRENYTKKPISQPEIYNPNMKCLMLSKCAKKILIFCSLSFTKKNYGDLRTPILLENKKMLKNKNMTIVWLILII